MSFCQPLSGTVRLKLSMKWVENVSHELHRALVDHRGKHCLAEQRWYVVMSLVSSQVVAVRGQTLAFPPWRGEESSAESVQPFVRSEGEDPPKDCGEVGVLDAGRLSGFRLRNCEISPNLVDEAISSGVFSDSVFELNTSDYVGHER